MQNHYLIHYSDYVYSQQIVCVLSQLLEGRAPESVELIPALQHIVWSVSDTYVVLTLYEPMEGKPVMRDRIGTHIQREIPSSQKIVYGEYLVFIVNLTKYGQTVDVLLSQIQRLSLLHLICGCSYAFCNLSKIFP